MAQTTQPQEEITTTPAAVAGSVRDFLCWFFETSLPVALVGLLGIAIAIVNIYQSRKLTQKKASLDFFKSHQTDGRIESGLGALGQQRSWEDYTGEQKNDILYFLNFFESLAVGLKSNIYSEEMTRDYFGTNLWLWYQEAKPYVDAIRAQRKQQKLPAEHQFAYASEFERLAEKFKPADTPPARE